MDACALFDAVNSILRGSRVVRTPSITVEAI
jgi:hypothetical protein